jgi:hypothetical protein
MRRMGLQYVILEHTVNGEAHFDLLLEQAGVERLRTLQLARWPLAPGQSCVARELPPHRHLYLTFEGPLSGGRGDVRRIEQGRWRDDGAHILLTPEAGPDVRLRFDGAAVARVG